MPSKPNAFGGVFVVFLTIMLIHSQANAQMPDLGDIWGGIRIGGQSVVQVIANLPDVLETETVVEGDYGEWQLQQYCPKGSYVYGITNHIEEDQGGSTLGLELDNDDTALNAITIHCRKPGDQQETAALLSNPNHWGSESARVDCPLGSSFVTGMRVKYEGAYSCRIPDDPSGYLRYDLCSLPSLGAPLVPALEPPPSVWVPVKDKTSANSVRIECGSGVKLHPSLSDKIGNWGRLTAWENCPAGSAVCGIQTRWQNSCDGCDDTALNGLKIHCCDMRKEYTIKIKTEDFSGSETSGPVDVQIVGSDGKTGWFALSETGFNTSQPYTTKSRQKDVGKVTGVRIALKKTPGAEEFDDWYLKDMTIKKGEQTAYFKYGKRLNRDNNQVFINQRPLINMCSGVGEVDVPPHYNSQSSELQDVEEFTIELEFIDERGQVQRSAYTGPQGYVRSIWHIQENYDQRITSYVRIRTPRLSTPWMRISGRNLYIDALLDGVDISQSPGALPNYRALGQEGAEAPAVLLVDRNQGVVAHVAGSNEAVVDLAAILKAITFISKQWNNRNSNGSLTTVSREVREGRQLVTKNVPAFRIQEDQKLHTTVLALLIAEAARFNAIRDALYRSVFLSGRSGQDPLTLGYYRLFFSVWKKTSTALARRDQREIDDGHYFSGITQDDSAYYFSIPGGGLNERELEVLATGLVFFCYYYSHPSNSQNIQSEEETCANLQELFPSDGPGRCIEPGEEVYFELLRINTDDNSISYEWSVLNGPSTGTLSPNRNHATFSASTEGDYSVQVTLSNNCGGQASVTFPIKVSHSECGPPVLCDDILRIYPEAPDGEYTLYVDGDATKPWTAYCHDMADEPAEYLSLVMTEDDANTSVFAAGGPRSGADVVTQFTKIRIDPLTFAVKRSDLTFATSTGGVSWNGGSLSENPYAYAGDCISTNSSAGRGNVDLRGTRFKIDRTSGDQFAVSGYIPAGTYSFSQADQVADLEGGGFCGFTEPGPWYAPRDLILAYTEETCANLQGLHRITDAGNCIEPGKEVSLKLLGIDTDDNSISYEWSVLNGPSTGTLSPNRNKATFSASTEGDYSVSVILSNNCGGQASATFPIKVSHSECGPPVLCNDILRIYPDAPDGEYTLYVDGDATKPWTAYCHDMADEPAEYLSLVMTEDDANTSVFAAGGPRSGADVVTQFTKIRIDPLTFAVKRSDLTFATSTGGVSWNGGSLSENPYAYAGDCISTNSSAGRGNVDLRGTRFKIDRTSGDQFAVSGADPAGTYSFSQADQVADLRGGGNCGFTEPGPWYAPTDLILTYID